METRMMRMTRRTRMMRNVKFRRKPLVWIFSAMSQLKIPPVGRIITIVWPPLQYNLSGEWWLLCGEVGTQVGRVPLVRTPPRALKPIHTPPPPPAPPPSPRHHHWCAAGASKTLLVHRLHSLGTGGGRCMLKWWNWCTGQACGPSLKRYWWWRWSTSSTHILNTRWLIRFPPKCLSISEAQTPAAKGSASILILTQPW